MIRYEDYIKKLYKVGLKEEHIKEYYKLSEKLEKYLHSVLYDIPAPNVGGTKDNKISVAAKRKIIKYAIESKRNRKHNTLLELSKLFSKYDINEIYLIVKSYLLTPRTDITIDAAYLRKKGLSYYKIATLFSEECVGVGGIDYSSLRRKLCKKGLLYELHNENNKIPDYNMRKKILLSIVNYKLKPTIFNLIKLTKIFPKIHPFYLGRLLEEAQRKVIKQCKRCKKKYLLDPDERYCLSCKKKWERSAKKEANRDCFSGRVLMTETSPKIPQLLGNFLG